MRFWIAAVTGLILSSVSATASARETRLELGAAFDGFGTYIHAMPALGLGDTSGVPRPLSGKLPSVGHLTLAGMSGELMLTADDRWVFPIIGGGLSAAVGSSPRVISSVDGSIAEQRPWSTYMGDVLLPGIGIRAKEQRWMFSAVLRTGVSIVGMNGSIASGADTVDMHGTGVSFLLRAQFEACRRLDPLERVCFTVSPSVYQFGFGNAVTAGLRWEFGP